MEAFLLILAVVLLTSGIIFSVMPPLPGPILTYLGILATHFATEETRFSAPWLIFFGIFTIFVTVVDYLIPAAATKKFGGTRAGILGGLIGTIVGVFSGMPFGILLGPLFGAVIGDLIGGNHFRGALKSGFGSFLGFIVATGMKVIYSCLMGVFIVWKIGALAINTIMEMFQ